MLAFFSRGKTRSRTRRFPRFQFSLQALFLLSLLSALGCGWLVVERERAQIEHAAIEELAPVQVVRLSRFSGDE